MRTKLLVLIAAVVLVAADAPDDAKKKDLEKLQGTWTMTGGEFDGNKIPPDQAKGELIFKDNTYSYTTAAGETGGGTFKIDPAKKPKQMDAVAKGGPLDGQTIEEIYELDGDTLKICLALPPAKRATDFTAPAESGRMMFTYKRKK